MHVTFPSTVAIVRLVELMFGGVDEYAVFCGELSIKLQVSRVIHRPLLYGLLIFGVMLVAVGSSSFRIEFVSIRVQVIPSGQICSLCELTLVEGAASAIGSMRQA